MLSLRRPSAEALRAFLASQALLGFAYPAVGATATVPPAGYAVGHARLKLGEGEDVFERAKAALGRWDQLRLGWMEAWSPDAPIQAGMVVAVFARMFSLWLLNACRVVYVVDEPGPFRRFGFAYGTLPDHKVTIARETDFFLEASLRRLASSGRFRRGAADRSSTRDRIPMSDRPSRNLSGMDLDLARRIDEVCRQFQADWREGRRRRIKDYLVTVSHEGRPALRSELEALERELRRSEGTP